MQAATVSARWRAVRIGCWWVKLQGWTELLVLMWVSGDRVVLEGLDEPLEHRRQGRRSGPAVYGGEQLPVPLNLWVVGDLQSDQQLAAVVGRVRLAEGLGVPADQVGQDQAGLPGGWVAPGRQC